MTLDSDDPHSFVDEMPAAKLPYQAPQLTTLSLIDTENNAGFSADAGLSVSGS